MRSFVLSALALLAAALAIPAAASAAVTPQAARAAVPSAPSGAIADVSCSGPATCVGIGFFEPFQSAEYFLRTWNGTTWSASFGSFPNSKNYSLAAFWCASPSHCIAVGSTNADGNGVPAPLAATWNGTTWSVTKAPGARHSAQGSQFTALSCSSLTFCVATGSWTRPTTGPTVPPSEGFADVWKGSKWSPSSQLSPKGASFLNGVSCLSARSCVAVGGTYTPYTVTFLLAKTAKPFIERWNGRKWTQAKVPVPAKGHGQLNDVSCWSAKGCEAVGFYYRHGSTLTSLLAEKWNGKAWKGRRRK